MLKKIKKLIIEKIQIKQDNTSKVYNQIDLMFKEISEDLIFLKLGKDLIGITDLLEAEISNIRDCYFKNQGLIIPPVSVCIDEYIQENQFETYINSHFICTEFCLLNKFKAVQEISSNINMAVKNNFNLILSNSLVEKYIDNAQKNNSRLIQSLMYRLDISGIKIILLQILEQGKSIKNINYIFEKMNEYAVTEKYNNPKYIAQKILTECIL